MTHHLVTRQTKGRQKLGERPNDPQGTTRVISVLKVPRFPSQALLSASLELLKPSGERTKHLNLNPNKISSPVAQKRCMAWINEYADVISFHLFLIK